MELAVGVPLAALLGFSAHRAGICTVKAVAELLTTHRAYMLASFARTALWVAAVSVLLTLAIGPPAQQPAAWSLTAPALLGGLLFGVGAAINMACTFSTLTGLADGRLGFLCTLAGMAAGIVVHAAVGVAPRPSAVGPAPSLLALPLGWLIALALLGWALWELVRLWRGRPRDVPLRLRLQLPVYRLSTAAALVGIANAVLFYAVGAWMVTSAMRRVAAEAAAPPPIVWVLRAALLAGMLASAVQRGSFAARLPRPGEAARHLAGGVLMGAGVAMVPGGNASLILHHIPAFSPHAVPAYLALVVGIAAGLLGARALGGSIPQISCGGDVCRMGHTAGPPTGPALPGARAC